MVKFSSFLCMSVALFAGIIIPVIYILVIKKKLKGSLKPFFTGCATFVIFALIVESALNYVLFNVVIGADKVKILPVWVIGIIGGLMAGIFEETGRFVAFKTVLKKDLEDKKTPFTYGAGHGGVEAFIILASGMITNIVLSIFINTGNGSILLKDVSAEQTAQILKILDALQTTSPSMYLVSVFERFTAMAGHILLSVIVWYGAKNKKVKYYFLAIFLHAFMDFIAVVLKNKIHFMWLEVVLICLVSLIGLFAIAVWYHEDKDPEAKREADLNLNITSEEV